MTYPAKAVPKGAWDTHHHIFEPSRFPFAAGRHFTPSVATLEQLKEFEASIGVAHVCIAHGLSYGPDCTSLLYYLGQFRGQARGICVLDVAAVTDAQLDDYHAAGIRSVRLDFFKAQAMHDVDGQVRLIEQMAARLVQWHSHARGWSIQIQQPCLTHWKTLRAVAARLPVPLVLDHMGLVRAPSLAPPGTPPVTATEPWQDLLGALRDGNLYVKISAPYRLSNMEPAYADLEPIVTQLVRANPKRVVWGSDWPHTQRHEDRRAERKGDAEPFLKVDNRRWLQSLSTWLSDEEWQAMWVDNPRTLYDYRD
ncbi:Amidohydrolase 2 [Niveomyces insectorum RCEF 264]|uniref:Amidohydrolase 2 n=1 Tax=Niveomyces insectorum RCEF 264 TaxID=1081102 RepID=A0A167YQ06_9HYPO|nr:Amidohydrolase 2 [Niveomyces insectorum RCEF 264]